MKKIQPFTIGTKLSVPNGVKCQDFVEITLPVAALAGSMLRNNINDRMSQTLPVNHNPAASEDGSEDEGDSVSRAASVRSIRKIAICGSTEMEGNCAVINLCSSTCEPHQKQNSTEKQIERTFSKSFPPLETEPWRKRKTKNLQHDYGISEFPLESSGDASTSRERDRKDFENSLIQLTTSLDLKDEVEGLVLQKPTVLDILGRRHSVGERIDKSWVKIRSIFQAQQDLVLALDVSEFYQHADDIINTINNMVKSSSLHETNVQSASENEKEIRKISRQIKMLNESAAWLSALHPALASRLARKQTEVQETWAPLQAAAGDQRVDVFSRPDGRGDGDVQCISAQDLAEPELCGVMEKHVKEERNRLRGSEYPWACRILRLAEEQSSPNPGSLAETSFSKPKRVTEKHSQDSESMHQLEPLDSLTPQRHFRQCELHATSVTELTTTADSVVSVHRKNDNFPDQEHRSTGNEEFLDQMETLWEKQRKRYELVIEEDPTDKDLTDDEASQMLLELPHANYPPQHVGEYSSGMLQRFLELLDNKQLPTLTLRVNEHPSRCAGLSMDTLHVEHDKPLLCDPGHFGIGQLQEQQDNVEVNYRLIGQEVKDTEMLVTPLQVPSTEKGDLLQTWEEVCRNMDENREHLAKFNQLQDYLSSYLALIAWAQSTRSCILSGSTADQWKDSDVPHIEHGIEQKLLEFDKLTAIGQRLVEEGNYLKQTIKERTEELKGMLEWIQAKWRGQRERSSQKKNLFVNMDSVKQENIQSTEMSQHSQNQVWSGVECSLGQAGVQGEFPGVLVQKPCPAHPSLSSSLCLILSFDEQSSCISQVCKQPSLSTCEVHTQLLPLSSQTQCQQSSVNNSATLQRCNEPVISHSKERKILFQSNVQDQHSQVHHCTMTQHLQDTNPVCIKPLQTTPPHTQLSQTTPAHTQLSQTTPPHTQLSQTTPPHTQLLQTTPLHTQLSQTTPLHTQLSQTTPPHTQLSQTTPAHTQLSQTTPAHTQLSQTTPPHTQLSQTTPAHTQLSQTTPPHTQLSQTTPAHTQLSQTTPPHTQLSQTTPPHTQPSQDMLQMQQLDSNIQIQRQQSAGNKEVQQQWSPRMIQIQCHQLPGNHMESQTSINDKKDRAQTTAANHVEQHPLPNTAHLCQQLSNNIPGFGDSEINLEENKQLTSSKICLVSSQNLDQWQNPLFISQGAKEKASNDNGQPSSQLILQLPDTNHMKDQQSSGKKPPLSSTKQTKIAVERVGPAEISHRVTTYLHVTDSPPEIAGSAAGCTKFPSSVSSTSSPSSLSHPPALSSSLSHPSLSRVISSQSCAKPKATSAGLEQPMTSNHQRHTTNCVIRCARCVMSPHSFRQRSNTWPEGRQRLKVHTQHQGFMKRDSFHVMCSAQPYPGTVQRDNLLSIASKPNNNIRAYLSPEYRVRFSLPQDIKLLCSSDSNVQSSVKKESSSAWPEGSDTSMALKPTPQADMEMQPVIVHNSLTQSDHKTVHMLDKVLFSPIYEKKNQQADKSQQRANAEQWILSTAGQCHWEVKGKHQDLKQHTSDEQYSESKGPFTVGDPTTNPYSLVCGSSSACKHNCPSIHTRIKDLKTHVFHASRHLQWNSQMRKKGAVQMADSYLDSHKLKLKRVIVCGERECAVCCTAPEVMLRVNPNSNPDPDCNPITSPEEETKASTAVAETGNRVIVPLLARQQFLEDEKELEDIWKGKADGTGSGWDAERGMKIGVSGVFK